MFESLTEKFNSVFRSLSGRGRITEANVSDAMHDVRKALLEADVNYKVVKQFCEDVRDKAVGAEVIKSLHPGQMMVKIVHDELVRLMGPVDTRIYFVSPGPTIIMMAGLQGSGKTTTCGKLAKYLVAEGQAPAAGRGDLQRPAAVEQFEILGEQVGRARLYAMRRREERRQGRPQTASAAPRSTAATWSIIDTAGRLHIDEEMMTQVGGHRQGGPAAPDLPGLRRDDRPGRRQLRQGVQRAAGARRRDPDQARRRRPRRRGPVASRPSPASPSSSSASARSSTSSRSSTPTAWPGASSAWATS